MGNSFTKILDNISYANWDKAIGEEDIPETRILAAQRIFVKGKNNDKKLLTYSDDYYKSSTQVDREVEHFF